MDFVMASLELESEKREKHTEKHLLQNKVQVFAMSSAAAVWQITQAGLCKAFLIAL